MKTTLTINPTIALYLALGIILLFSQGYSKEPECDRAAQATYDKIKGVIHQIRISGDTTANLVKIDKALKVYARKYPDHPNNIVLAFVIAGMIERYDINRAKIMYQKVIDSGDRTYTAPAESTLKQLVFLGKPITIQFMDISGNPINLAKMKGNVVLIDFWATWCKPCVREIPQIVQIYDKYHQKGLEIIGISFDENLDSLKQMIQEKKMLWPQYFDGKIWGNTIAIEYGIIAVPTMWLVDKTGVLVDIHAGEELEDKIAELLKK
jgi:thiol-disulfide isomerase/thioredoxin